LSLMKLEDPSVIGLLQQCMETESDPSVAVVLKLAVNQLSRDD